MSENHAALLFMYVACDLNTEPQGLKIAVNVFFK